MGFAANRLEFQWFGCGTPPSRKPAIEIPQRNMPMKPLERVRRAKIQQAVEGYLELGMPRQALGALDRLGDPTDFDARSLHLWGEALRMQERFNEALLPLARAAEVAPGNIHVWLALGWCYKRTDQLELAIESLEKALCCEPTEALLHYNLACYWSLAGVKQRAMKYLSQALEISPDYILLVDDEPDFDMIRFDPDFRALCDRSTARG